MIKLNQVEVAVPVYPSGTKTILAANLELAESRIALIGANGSGKSTLLRLLNGLVLPSKGSVEVCGHDTVKQARQVRNLVGFVFTDPLSQLVMSTPADDIELSLRKRIKKRSERRDKAISLLADYGLAGVAEQSIYDLSGGERQLAALVSVLAIEPKILVADEPTTLLDLKNRNYLVQTLLGLPQQLIVATHDLAFAAQFDRVILVDNHRVIADGNPAAVISHYRKIMS